MLVDVIGDLLPSAVAVALSPVPIIAITLVLDSPNARTRGLAFALGWVTGLLVVSSTVLVIADGGDPDAQPSVVVSWIKVAVGVLFFALAVRQWRGRAKDGTVAEPPAWMGAVDEMSAARITALAAALSGLNPKNLALTVAAVATIAQAGLGGGATAGAVAVFVSVGSVTVAGPVLLSLVAPSRAAGPLRAMRDFMATHNAAIMLAVLVVLGAKLLGNGLAGL